MLRCADCHNVQVAYRVSCFVLMTGGLGKSTLDNKVYTEMKTMKVFSEDSSKYVTFDLEPQSNDDAVISEVQRWLSCQTGPVLLLLDNVQRQRQLDDILNDTNLEDKSFVLVTSRRRDHSTSRLA
jgi:hypothetical protein